jgi:hypothetical protein
MTPRFNSAHPTSIRVLGSTGGVASEWQQWSSGGVGATTEFQARFGVERVNLLRCELLGVLGKGLRGSTGSRCNQREEFGEAGQW